MQKTILFILLFLVNNAVFSQTYLDKISIKLCSCFEKTFDSTSMEISEMKFNICLIDESKPYKNQILKDYAFNVETMDEKLGTKYFEDIGMTTVKHCPDIMMRVMKLSQENNETSSLESIQIFEGTVIKIEKNDFVVFHIKDKMNKLLKIYWLGSIESNKPFESSYMNYLTKKVSITYSEMELFDHKINEYRSYKILKSLESL